MTTAETMPLPEERGLVTVKRSGSDFMVDVFKTLPMDYVALVPGSTFRGLQESLINYGMNKKPEIIMCLHEEIAVGVGHGYSKVAGKPIGALVHGVVGLQHASMAIYNAWADRASVFVMTGNPENSMERRPGVEWIHSAQDMAATVRDFTKWDDNPMSLGSFAESAVRGWQIATTPPFAPVLLTADLELQELPITGDPVSIPRLSPFSPAVADPTALTRAAQMLVAAELPVLVLDRAVRSDQTLATVVELAEALGAAVIDKGGRMNFPSRHKLNYSMRAKEILPKADVVMGIEVDDLFGVVNGYSDRIARTSHLRVKPSTKLINLSSAEFLIHANFQDFQRYQPVDLAISGDGDASLPPLLEAVKHALPKSDRYAERGEKLGSSAAAHLDAMRVAATYGWQATPISTARLCAEIMAQLEHEEWALTTQTEFQSNWQLKLWDFRKHWQYIGRAGGFGVGYNGPASVGAALAHRDAGGGRIPVAILGDGDLMMCPQSFWTAAHHRLPILMVMHNNRAYFQEYMHVQRMADRRARGIERAWIGTVMEDPAINFAKLADSMGVWSIGPVIDPEKLAPALKQAVAVVKSGQPALVDVVCQAR